MVLLSSVNGISRQQLSCSSFKTEIWSICRLNSWYIRSYRIGINRAAQLYKNCSVKMYSVNSTLGSSNPYEKSKRVWIWTESKQVMTAAVERGWNTFIFSPQTRELANDWSSMALINPLFIKEGEIFDRGERRVATIFVVSTPQELQRLQPADEQAENIVIDLLDWQVIPAENIVAAFQESEKTVFAISKTTPEAQMFLEALEQGLGGVVLKVEEVKAVLELKEYFDRRNEVSDLLTLTKVNVTRVDIAGMGDRVCVDLCSLMRPGEGLLVGSFARGLFLVHSECLESNYIASRPFRVNAVSFALKLISEDEFHDMVDNGSQESWVKNIVPRTDSTEGPVHAYVLVPGGKTCYLSELKSGKEVIVVDQKGHQRTAIVGRVKIESRPLILVEAKCESDNETVYSLILQNAETVALISPCQGNGVTRTGIPVTSLKVGDEVLLRVQGGARHTGIEIKEFIVEN